MNRNLSNFINYGRKGFAVYEFSVCWNGFKFQILYGQMHNGDREQWFIAIPEEEICCIADEPTNIFTNAKHLLKIVGYDKKAEAIATAIMEHYLSTNFDKKGDIN